MLKSVQIKKIPLRVYLLAVYALLSLLYYYITFSIVSGISCLNLEHLINFTKDYLPIIAVAIATFIAIVGLRKSAFYLSILLYSLIILSVISLISVNFEKFTLVSLFVVSCSMILNLMILSGEMQKACYNPKYSPNDIEIKNCYPIKAEILLDDGKKKISCLVTNLDAYGCFVRTGEILPRNVKIRFYSMQSELEVSGVVVSNFIDGHGIEVRDNKRNNDWHKIFNYLSGRGYINA
jgi:hypothetical protein